MNQQTEVMMEAIGKLALVLLGVWVVLVVVQYYDKKESVIKPAGHMYPIGPAGGHSMHPIGPSGHAM